MVAYITIMLHLLILVFATLTEGSPVAPTHLLVTRVGPCYEFDLSKDVVAVSEMSLSRGLYESTLAGWINVSVDISNGWTVKAIMQKCHDIRNLDTCDLFKEFKVISNGCTDSEQEDIYSMFFHYVKPNRKVKEAVRKSYQDFMECRMAKYLRHKELICVDGAVLECPIKAGRYKISGYPFFTEDSDLTASESKISTSVFGYTYRLQGFDDEDKRLLCIDAILQLLYIREHDWRGPKDFHVNSTSDSVAKLDRPIGNGDSQNTNHGGEDRQVEGNEEVEDGEEVQKNENNASADEEQNEE